MKRTVCLILSFLLMCVFSSCEKEKSEQSGEKIVYTVNEEGITQNEIDYFKNRLRASVLNEFMSKYSVEYTDAFWQTEFDGITPLQVLEERSLEESAMARLQLSLMEDEGIYDDSSFSALYEKAEMFNRENENKSGVVGLKSIDMSQFYTYYLENGIMELKNIYIKGKLKPTDDEIEKEKNEVISEYSEGESSREFSQEEIENIALGHLEEKKYESYISNLYKKAEIRKVD